MHLCLVNIIYNLIYTKTGDGKIKLPTARPTSNVCKSKKKKTKEEEGLLLLFYCNTFGEGLISIYHKEKQQQ